MKNILVPIGTSPDCQNLLQYAVNFAVEFSSTIFVMDVFSVSGGAGDLANISAKVAQSNKQRIKEIVEQVDAKDVTIKIATYNGGIIDGLLEIDKELGIDLIITSPKSNDIREELYLGNTSGRIIKRTDIPTLVVPRGNSYSPFKTALTAFRSGVLKKNKILNPLKSIISASNTQVHLLLVKTPDYTMEDLKINTALMDISSGMTITEHASTYLGVIEHLQSHNPDLLCVFRRKRGFFKSLWEKNTIPKSEFSARIPVLILSVKK